MLSLMNTPVDTFKVQVYLVVVAVDHNNSTKNSFLISKNLDGALEFPNRFLDYNTTPKDIARDLLWDHAAVTEDWAIIHLLGVVEVEAKIDVLTLLYSVFIPEPTRIRVENDHWLSYQSLSNHVLHPSTTKLAYETIWRPA